jgi:hypothetical protein
MLLTPANYRTYTGKAGNRISDIGTPLCTLPRRTRNNTPESPWPWSFGYPNSQGFPDFRQKFLKGKSKHMASAPSARLDRRGRIIPLAVIVGVQHRWVTRFLERKRWLPPLRMKTRVMSGGIILARLTKQLAPVKIVHCQWTVSTDSRVMYSMSRKQYG